MIGLDGKSCLSISRASRGVMYLLCSSKQGQGKAKQQRSKELNKLCQSFSPEEPEGNRRLSFKQTEVTLLLRLAVGYGRLDSLKDRQRPVLQALSRRNGKDPRSPCPLRLSTPRMVQKIDPFSEITAIVILDFIVFTLLFEPNF